MLSMPRPSIPGRVRALAASAVLIVLLAVLAVSGCGGGKQGGSDVLLAKVGAKEIRSGYYEDRLGRLQENELPRGPGGQPLDMATPAGKSEFLTTLINKELMVQKAEQLGYANDKRIADAAVSLTRYEAGLAMWQDVIGEPANELSNEEVDAIYANLGRQRKIQYVICNFEADAVAARKMALDGADWEDVVSRYHSGVVPNTGTLEMVIPFGRFAPEFEGPIFAVAEGEVTEPISTEYGWWVVRVVGEKEVARPDRDAALAGILDLTRNRKIAKLRNEFREKVHEQYKLHINDDALLKCWDGLPDKEDILDPATNQPVPQDRLVDLRVAPADLDLDFYSYELDGTVRRFTLGDYKIKFDRMNTFQRPKKSAMLGGLRTHLVNELERALMDAEAHRRGYDQTPEVKTKVAIKVEEMMVTALYSEIVTIDERITPEQLDAYWAEHHAEFDQPERRSGRLVLAAGEEKAREAHAKLVAGARWADVVAEYGTDPKNIENQGKLTDVPADASGPVRDALYALAPETLGEPFDAGEGRWGVVRLDKVTPGGPVELHTVSEAVGRVMKTERKEAAFNKLLGEWAGEFGVERFDENLDKVKSWKELTYVEAPGPAVPRN